MSGLGVPVQKPVEMVHRLEPGTYLNMQRMEVVNARDNQLPHRAATLMSAQVILEYIRWNSQISKLLFVLVDCIWTDWTWGSCSKTCGGGTQSGTRAISQAAKNGGNDCTGSSTTTRSCNPHACPTPGEWKTRALLMIMIWVLRLQWLSL